MKKLLLKIYAWLVMPIQNNTYNKQWDLAFSELLDKYEFTDITPYTAKLGNTTIWIANKPYACMNPHEMSCIDIRPSRANILRAIKKLNKQQDHIFNAKISEYINSINQA